MISRHLLIVAAATFRKVVAASSLALAAFASASSAHASKFEVIYSFEGGTDGAQPVGTLRVDKLGNIVGATRAGGKNLRREPGHPPGKHCGKSCGTIYGLSFAENKTPTAVETVIYAFCSKKDCTDGVVPLDNVISDKKGNLFGTTSGGGQSGCFDDTGCGVVFKISPDGREHVLYTFTGGNDGGHPSSGVIADKQGNLYGTTVDGGIMTCSDFFDEGCGVLYKLARDGTQTILHSFCSEPSCTDGWYPSGGLLEDKAGNLYGTTSLGGDQTCNPGNGCGVVFKLSPSGTYTVLHTFRSDGDGINPQTALIMDKAGNLYGTTAFGGGSNCTRGQDSCGTVFKVAPDGTETVLYAFKGGRDGALPFASPLLDRNGNLYGTTANDGNAQRRGCDGLGCGTVYKVTQDGTETVLHRFGVGNQGGNPFAGLIFHKGYLFGSAINGGEHHHGTIFRIKP